jgi:hypothetical protein
MIDLEDLKAKLTEYDPAASKCQLQIARFVNYATDHITSLNAEYHDYDVTTYVPCCRPEGHEGECRNARQVMGWPGFQTVSQLIAEVERLREVNDGYLLEIGRQHALLRDQKRGENAERAAVVAWLRGSDDDLVADYGDDIERGEHRREETK